MGHYFIPGTQKLVGKMLDCCDREDKHIYINYGSYTCSGCGKTIPPEKAKNIVEMAIKEYLKTEVSKIVKECQDDSRNVQSEFRNDGIDIIKESKDGLMKYLSKAIEIEQSLYAIERRMLEVYDTFLDSKDKSENAEKEYEEALKKQQEQITKSYENKELKALENNYGLKKLPMPCEPSKPCELDELGIKKPDEPVYKSAGFFNKKKIEKENDLLREHFEKAMQEYQNAIDSYNSDMKKYENAVVEYESEKKSVINKNKEIQTTIQKKRDEELQTIRKRRDDEIKNIKNKAITKENSLLQVIEYRVVQEEMEMAKKAYSEVYAFRELFYEPGIIHKKYQNLSALSMIYEYFDTGRCSELEGADGAYNLYESELRSEIVIDKLDVVIDKLDAIRKTQYTMCNILEKVSDDLGDINNELHRACDSLDKIEKNTKQLVNYSRIIAENTALSAYYSKRTAYYAKMTATINVVSFLGL